MQGNGVSWKNKRRRQGVMVEPQALHRLDVRMGLAAAVLWLAAAGGAHAQHRAYNLPPAIPEAQVQQVEAERRALFQKIQANPADLDASFAYAVLSTRLGDYEAAIATYERMLVQRPETPRLQLELAALYFRLGAYAPARLLFDKVRERADTPPEVLRKVESYMVVIDANARERGGFSGRVNIGARYDSNANAAPDGTTINLNGIDFQLAPGSRAVGDLSGQLSAQMRYRQPVSHHGDVVDFTLSGATNRYRDLDHLNSNMLELRVGPDLALSRWGMRDGRLSLSAGVAQTWLDGSRYMHSHGLAANLRKPVGRESAIGVSLDWRNESYTPAPAYASARGFSGDRYRGAFTYTRQMGNDWQWMISPAAEWHQAAARYNAYWEPQLNLGLSYRYPALIGSSSQPWTLALTSQMARRSNDAPMPVVSRTREQRGNELLVQAVQSIPLRRNLELQVYAGYRKVASNYDLRDYSNGFMGFTLSQGF